ncbi:MAG TPA: hypothetical protein VIE40_08655, partial [Dehalococcoidia bacterium]
DNRTCGSTRTRRRTRTMPLRLIAETDETNAGGPSEQMFHVKQPAHYVIIYGKFRRAGMPVVIQASRQRPSPFVILRR